MKILIHLQAKPTSSSDMNHIRHLACNITHAQKKNEPQRNQNFGSKNFFFQLSANKSKSWELVSISCSDCYGCLTLCMNLFLTKFPIYTWKKMFLCRKRKLAPITSPKQANLELFTIGRCSINQL